MKWEPAPYLRGGHPEHMVFLTLASLSGRGWGHTLQRSSSGVTPGSGTTPGRLGGEVLWHAGDLILPDGLTLE